MIKNKIRKSVPVSVAFSVMKHKIMIIPLITLRMQAFQLSLTLLDYVKLKADIMITLYGMSE